MTRLPIRHRLGSFVEELRRRRVFRVLIAYAVVGVGVAEGADIFFPALGFPGWTVSLVALLVLLGLPVALGLAWAFDVVPDAGVDKATDPARGHRERVEDLFVDALEVEPSRRDAFLEAGASGDPALLAEVRSLLAAHERQGPLDESRALVPPSVADAGGAGPAMVGRRVFHYEILEHLGGGGMGVVYKARDTRLGRVVALKFLSAHLLASAEAKERFMVEAQAAAALDHPNLCTIYEVGETAHGELYIAMAFYEGETLQRRLGRGPISQDEALNIAAQTGRGLARAAEQGIIHRDIKPANLIITPDGTVKIVDFGLAKMVGGDLTQTGTRMGTIAYMSPEQTMGDPVDQRTDVWSVGVVLYEMLTGARPFTGGNEQAVIHAILNLEPLPLDRAAPHVSPGVAAVVDRAIEKDLNRRYPDAAGLLADIERLLSDPTSRSPLDSTPSLPPEGERRRITVLVCSITGFETLLDSLDLVAVEHELSSLRALVQNVVEDYGGVLNEFAEDRMTALFGVPVTHEDDGLRAVRAALEIHARASSVSPRAGAVELRSAVGAGQVAIQAMDSGERRYRIGGTVARDVYRLASAAQAGDLLISPELERALSPFVETVERKPVRLATDAAPITPVAVLRESGLDSRLEATPPGSLSRFVGRANELRTMTQALEGAQSGAGRIISIVGDAGVGKSRLLHEFRTRLARDGIHFVQGRCQSHGGLTHFVPFIECVRAMLGLGRGTEELSPDEVVDGTRALAPELDVYVPLLLHLLAIESDEYPLPSYLEGDDLRAAVGEALVSVFTLGSRGQPLVVLLEDWHWADGGSSDVLQQLTEMVSAYPLLVVVTSRPEEPGGSPPPRGDVHLDLAPLDLGSATEVMQEALLGSRVPEELAAEINEKTGGNPFFIEELCHTLLESGTIVLEDDQARLAGSLERLSIPDTVQAVLKTRLDRLDPEAREVLRSASVIGRQFGLELLSRVVPSRSRLEGALDGLRSAGLIQRTSLIPEPTYRFKHALTLDVTYDSLLERQRKERHALVGEAMESVYESRLDEMSERLAEHFAVAEDWDRAIRYGQVAAERAAGLHRLQEAVRTLGRTREWMERRGDDEGQLRSGLVELLLKEERHLETLGWRGEQQKVIDQLLDLLEPESGPELAEVYVRQGELLTLLGHWTEAEKALSRAIQIAEAHGATDVRVMALRAVGHGLWRRGMVDDALALLTEVVEHDRLGASATLLIRDLVNLGRIHREQGDFEAAQRIGEEARQLADTTGSPLDRVYSINYTGHLLRVMGRGPEAIEWFNEGSRIAEEAHLPVRQSFNLLATGALYVEQGQIDEALAAYEEAILLSRRANRADNLANGLTLLGDVLITLGRPADATPRYEEAVTILEGIGQRPRLSEAMGKLARAREAAGLPDAAGTWREVWELRAELGDRAGMLEAAERQAALFRGPTERARELNRSLLHQAEELGDRASAARTRNRLATLAWREEEFEEARREYEAALELLEDQEDPEGLGVVLNGLGATLTRLGRREEAIEVLERALKVNRLADVPTREADSMAALGAAHRAAGNLTRAYDWYQQCAEKRADAGDRPGEGWALLRLSELSREAGAEERARALAGEALSIAREVGDGELEEQAKDRTTG